MIYIMRIPEKQRGILLAHSRKKCYYDKKAILIGIGLKRIRGVEYDFQKKDI